MKTIVFLILFFNSILYAKCIDKTFKNDTFLHEPKMTTMQQGENIWKALSNTTTLMLDWDKCWEEETGQFKLYMYDYRNDLKDMVLIQYIYKLNYGLPNDFKFFVEDEIKKYDFASKIKNKDKIIDFKKQGKALKIQFSLSFAYDITYKVVGNKLILDKFYIHDDMKNFR